MKQIIAILIFLMGGIYAESKLNLIETFLLLLMIILIDLLMYFISNYSNEHKYRFKDYDSLINNLKKFFNVYRVITVFIFFILGYFLTYLSDNHQNKIVLENFYTKKEYEAKVIDVYERENDFKTKLYIKDVKENIEMYISKEITDELLPGYKVIISGNFSNVNEAKNLGMYNEKEYKKQKRIYYNFFGDVLSVKKGRIFLITNLYKIRNKISKIYDSILDKKYSSIIKAMIVGENSMLDDETKDLYKKGGVFHILAISGLHVGIISMFLKKILSKISTSNKINAIVLVSILFAYVILTGSNISTLRAFMMCMFSELALLLKRNYDKDSGLYMSAIILLILNTQTLFNASFILSFGCMLAMKYKLKLFGFLRSQSANISLFILMSPILSYLFNSIQGLSVLANIFILPLCELLVLSSLVSVFFYFVNINVAVMVGRLITLILMYYEEVLTYLSNFSLYEINIERISIFQLLLWYLAYFFLYTYLKTKNDLIYDKRKRYYSIRLFALCITLFFLMFVCKNSNVDITFIDVDHGDSILINDRKEHKVMLVDGGGTNDKEKDKGTYNVYPYLKYRGIDKIDACVVTHADRDHIKGIIEIIKLVNVNNVFINKIDNENYYFNQLIKLCEEKNIKVTCLKQGDEFYIGRVKIDVLYPPKNICDYNFSSNNSSLVLDLLIGDKKVLLTGDIESEAEEMILNSNLVSLNDNDDYNYYILKIAHHGSNTSSLEKLIKLINPKYGIISGNKSNITNFNKKNKYVFKQSVIIDTYNSGMINFNLKGKVV